MTITEQKAFLRSYTGQAQTPADFAQRWQETVAALHPAVSCAPVAFGNPCGVYERPGSSAPPQTECIRCC